jgi:long-chain acyl-CoA synthetase
MLYRGADGRWKSISHLAIARRVRHVALGLIDLGLAAGDRVAILCENRPEWAIADYGCLTARFASVPIYPTLPAEQIPHILNDSGTAALFVSTAAQAAKIAEVRAQCPALRHVIGIDAGAADGCDLTLAELEARGAASTRTSAPGSGSVTPSRCSPTTSRRSSTPAAPRARPRA